MPEHERSVASALKTVEQLGKLADRLRAERVLLLRIPPFYAVIRHTIAKGDWVRRGD